MMEIGMSVATGESGNSRDNPRKTRVYVDCVICERCLSGWYCGMVCLEGYYSTLQLFDM